MPTRRRFLSITLATTAALSLGQALAATRPKRILLRSSWQTVNIGDIAHTPGVLHLLEKHLPGVEVVLWPSNVDNGVDELLLERFPKLTIAKKGSPELEAAFQECDFLLHGSGASLVAQRDVIQWIEKTGKPYGIYGITLSPKESAKTSATPEEQLAQTIAVLSGSRFVFYRDTLSLAFAREKGSTCPVMQFGPDGAFACDLRDDARAEAFLAGHNLEEGNFLCCIPRLRYTPYWTIPGKNQSLDPVKHARNEAMKEHDHAPLRQAILQVIEQTDLRILLCPEDQTQMQVGRELLLEKLPAPVRKRVVWRPDYWLTGEAISTYTRSAGLFGNEMHSPIMCIGHGIPAIVCRWAEQTTKGHMWNDIGLGDWLFDLDDEAQVREVTPAVLEMARNPEAAREKAARARAFVEKRQGETMAII